MSYVGFPRGRSRSEDSCTNGLFRGHHQGKVAEDKERWKPSMAVISEKGFGESRQPYPTGTLGCE